MGRLRFCDYAGDEMRSGDLVTYASRRGNEVRMADGRIQKAFTRKMFGRMVPMLKVKPTGSESGILRSRSDRVRNIAVKHVRLVRTLEELAAQGDPEAIEMLGRRTAEELASA